LSSRYPTIGEKLRLDQTPEVLAHLCRRWLPCPTCGAQRDEPCKILHRTGSPSGVNAHMHKARVDAGRLLYARAHALFVGWACPVCEQAMGTTHRCTAALVLQAAPADDFESLPAPEAEAVPAGDRIALLGALRRDAARLRAEAATKEEAHRVLLEEVTRALDEERAAIEVLDEQTAPLQLVQS
jgi:hypothetical protein